MKRLFIVLVASLVLGLVGGVSRAWAGDGLLPPPPATTDQSATQSNDGSNTATQTAKSEPTVLSGPNVAIANGSSCNPCGGDGTTTQNSGNNVDSSASNTATQSNTQSNDAGQTQTVGSATSGDPSQSLDQSNNAENTADQTATSKPVVISGPNVAVLNSGNVNQNSGNDVESSASNSADQSNTQKNEAGQSQTVSSGSCCHSGDGASQSATQSNEASNDANQTAKSEPVVISGGNYAILNKGDVQQNSGNNVDSSASNDANQSNYQQNSAGQSQTVADRNACCDSHTNVSQSADQSNNAENTANQTATSKPVVISGPNVAIGNGWFGGKCNPCGDGGGSVSQNSGNWVDSSASNTATQSNRQSNDLDQTQTVTGGSGCCGKTGDVSQEADQSNSADNTANQRATSNPFVESGDNVALLNKGDTSQNSGNWVDSSASNTATQSNRQSNDLDQTQSVDRGDCCRNDCNPCKPCKPSCPPKCEPKPCEPKCSPCDGKYSSPRGVMLV